MNAMELSGVKAHSLYLVENRSVICACEAGLGGLESSIAFLHEIYYLLLRQLLDFGSRF